MSFRAFLIYLAIGCAVLTWPAYATASPCGLFDWCCGVVLGFMGKPTKPPQNPVGEGYGVTKLNDNVRKGVLLWVPESGWSYLDNSYKRKLDNIILGNGADRRIDFKGLDIMPGKTALVNYVIRLDGTIVVGMSRGPQIFKDYGGKVTGLPHPTLASDDGTIQRVLAAGQILINQKNGKIVEIDLQSGHYQPGREAIPVVEKAFESYSDLFDKEYRGVSFSLKLN